MFHWLSIIKPFFRRDRNFPYLLLLFSLIILSYSSIWWGDHPLKWDIIDYYFPNRHFIAQCVDHHVFPLWNPYLTFGYPIHADPQSGMWYPPTMLFIYFFSYPLYAVHIETIFHLLVAAFGMFFLLKQQKVDSPFAVLLAFAFASSGFFVGNAQHLTWIISAAWIPWVLLFFMHSFFSPSFFNNLAFAFFFFLLFSAGYPAFTFVMLYVLVFLFIVFYITHYSSFTKKIVIKQILFFFFSIMVVGILSLFIIISSFDVLAFLNRADGITYAFASFGPLHPKALLSLFLPFGVANHDVAVFHSDLSMINVYFGASLFLFLLSSLCRIKSFKSIQWIWMFLLLFSLLASFGSYTPLHKFLFDYFPLLDLFRFPALYRIFFILFSLLLLSSFLKPAFEEKAKDLRRFKWVLLSFSILLLLTPFYIRFSHYLNLKNLVFNELFKYSMQTNIAQHIALQALINGFFLFLLFAVFQWVKTLKWQRTLFISLVILEITLAVRLNAAYTIYDSEVSLKNASQFVEKLPQDFKAPSLSFSPYRMDSLAMRQTPFWRNLALINQSVSAQGFTPFKFVAYEYLADSVPDYFMECSRQPIAFFADTIVAETLFLPIATDTTRNFFPVFISDSQLTAHSGKSLPLSNDNIALDEFKPGSVSLTTRTFLPRVLVLLQSDYPGWNAQIDEVNIPILKINNLFMGLPIPTGEHKVSFHYKPPFVVPLFFISNSLFFLIFIFLIFTYLRKKIYFNRIK